MCVYTYMLFWDNYGTISFICCDIHIIYGIFSFLVQVLILCTSVNLHVLIRFSILTIQLLGYPHFRTTPHIYIYDMIFYVKECTINSPYFLFFPISLPSFTRKPRPFLSGPCTQRFQRQVLQLNPLQDVPPELALPLLRAMETRPGRNLHRGLKKAGFLRGESYPLWLIYG